MNNFQGNWVGTPKASELKKFPQRPIVWPRITDGTKTSSRSQKGTLRQRQNKITAIVAPDQCTMDRNSPLPNRKYIPPGVLIGAPFKGHVVETRADNGSQHKNGGEGR